MSKLGQCENPGIYGTLGGGGGWVVLYTLSAAMTPAWIALIWWCFAKTCIEPIERKRFPLHFEVEFGRDSIKVQNALNLREIKSKTKDFNFV